jgi:hypothetical protein
MDSDFALLERWCAGDASAGEQLFTRHFADIYRFFEHKVAARPMTSRSARSWGA